jgi:hypothetical protein
MQDPVWKKGTEMVTFYNAARELVSTIPYLDFRER